MPTPEAIAAPTEFREGTILILGIGNTLLSDEGFGVHVIERLRGEGGLGAGVVLVDGGTLSFTLAPAIEDSECLVVVDAAELGTPPGSLRVFEDRAMDEFLGAKRRRSVHEVGLLDILSMARLAGRLPGRRALVAVQPEHLGWGEVPGDAVARAIPEACRAVRHILEGWRA